MKYVVEIKTDDEKLDGWYELKNELMSIRGIKDVEKMMVTIWE